MVNLYYIFVCLLSAFFLFFSGEGIMKELFATSIRLMVKQHTIKDIKKIWLIKHFHVLLKI